jgi:phospho-N-acetylmuramoyl-pentapeptide-transferase
MLYYLHELSSTWGPLNVFQYITVRAMAGAATAFLLILVLAPWVIRKLQHLQIKQYVRKEEAAPLYVLHARKEGTPTMGGLMIIGALVISTLLWARPGNIFVLLTLATTCFMGLIGFIDDSRKIMQKGSKGLRARTRLMLEAGWAVVVIVFLLQVPDTRDSIRTLLLPFMKDPFLVDMHVILIVVLVTAVLVGATNAVNLTDGLDGLAIGCTSSVALTYLVMAYVTGHVTFAKYLFIPYIDGSGELAVLCGCLLGASLGFLWYNCHPAQVFMGDTGSLAIGGTIAMVAILIRQELALVIVGGVFVMEAVSVILQVVSFKTRGKRIFAMAPIHHHFEMKKWSETQVTIRFWILSIIFALLGVMTLKVR